MTKTPFNLQELRRRIYQKAKAEPTHRFWGLFVHITKMATLHEAYQHAKKNGGAPGIDGQSFADVEQGGVIPFLESIQAELIAGTYSPQANRKVDIRKDNGKTRTLQIPTVADRIAQMVAKIYFEPLVEPYFHADSYGYRPGKSPLDAVEITRKRCWQYNWVLEFDIVGLFDNIDHELLMRAVKKHTNSEWIILYIERWLKAPFKMKDGSIVERVSGTPQGGVISPVLANLFLHYAFDKWMEKNQPQNPWARYADDGVVHCRTQEETEKLHHRLEQRFKECGLELHPDKTRIVYCKDDNRSENHSETSFDFLGYTFRARQCKSRHGKYFIGFTPAVSNKALKHMRQTIRHWRIYRKTVAKLEEIAREINPVLRGWINYYGHFCKSQMYPVYRHMNKNLVLWARRKYKTLKTHPKRAVHWLGNIAKREPNLFDHWKRGLKPTSG